ncbi:MAG: Mfa1 fimbrilin C-terminal domain-containing protein [Alloprevotella sp.]
MKKFMIAALAAGMLTACSDSAVVEAPADGGAQWGADGTGYVSLSINMPTVTGVGRANDVFDDGLATEYTVKDAVLILFKGANEADAKFEAAYNLPINFSNTGTSTDQITATSKITKRIAAITTGASDNIYALVMLNAANNNVFKVTNDKDQEKFESSDAKINVNGTMTDMTDKSFKDVQKIACTIPTNVDDGLVMVNAPLTDSPSQSGTAPSGNVTTLAVVNKANIRSSAAESANNPAATIYVERTSAKVTIQYDESIGVTDGGLKGTISESNSIKYQIVGFALDNTNDKSYIVRSFDNGEATDNWGAWRGLTSAASSLVGADTRYRFAGASPVASGVALYRTYFAKDMNFADDVPTGLTTKTGVNTRDNVGNLVESHDFTFIPVPAAAGYSAAAYCRENVFDVKHMDWVNTTRAILKVHFGNEGDTDDMVMWNNDTKNFYTVTEATKAGGKMAEKIIGLAAFKAAYPSITNASTVAVAIEQGGTPDPDNIYRVTKVVVGSDVITSGDLFDAAKEYFGAISYYVQGIGYYQVRIKHFGDDLTPWGKGEGDDPKAGSTSTTYPGSVDVQKSNYLGRYGMLRNNWYNLTIKGVKVIGTPYIVDVEDANNKNIPDDEMKSYITVEINILSWAKREQSVILE